MSGKLPTVKEIKERFGYDFILRVGEDLGNYTIIKKHISHLTLRCKTCGAVVTIAINVLKLKDLNNCLCKTFPEKYFTEDVNIHSPYSKLGIRKAFIKRQIQVRLKSLGLDINDFNKYLDGDEILKYAGEKPESTPFHSYELYIKDNALPYPENFYWKKVLKTSCINQVQSYTRTMNRNILSGKLNNLSEDELKRAVTHGLQVRTAPASFNYETMLNKVYGSLQLTSLVQKESNGLVYYSFHYKCIKCGHCGVKRASVFRKKIKGQNNPECLCPKCNKHLIYSLCNTRNSAVVLSNKFGKYNGLYNLNKNFSLFTRESMNQFIGYFTLYAGTEEFMDAFVTASLQNKQEMFLDIL